MSESRDPRIGTRRPDGTRVYPALTLNGRRYTMPPAGEAGLDAEHFVVLDPFPPRGFDAAAEIEALRASLTPAPAKRKNKSEDTVGPETDRQ